MREILAITKALSDENRLRILMCLEDTTLCLCHITEIVGLAPSTVSKHLQVLSEAGLLTSRQDGRWRYYRWAEREGTRAAKRALQWVREGLAHDPTKAEDAQKRAIALQNSPAPCPQEPKPRVLFLCTGNSCRSQMAEGLLRKHAGGMFEVFSAGLEPREISPLAVEVMDEVGVNIRGQRSKSVMEFLGKTHFGYLITVCSEAESRCPIFPGVSNRLHWPVEDPERHGGTRKHRYAKFRETREELERRILEWLKALQERDSYH
jgi:arsenate reductase